MKQALHIFRKDVRHLRWEIVLLLAIIALFAWSEHRVGFRGDVTVTDSFGRFDRQVARALEWINPMAQFLLVVLALFLPGRLVHDEALPGERQFWLTRPYSRWSLLGAKCLFLVVFAIVPMTLSDVALVTAKGFPVWQYLSGLAWEQALRAALVLLPALALAAITRNVTSQIFTAIGGGVVCMFFLEGFYFGSDAAQHWTALGWIYNSIVVTVVMVCCAAVVLWQYAKRATFGSRIVLGCGAALAALVPLLPSKAALAIETHGQKGIVDPFAIRIALDPPVAREDEPPSYRRSRFGPVRLPLRIGGVPAGFRMWADEVKLDIQSPEAASVLEWIAVDHSRVTVIAELPDLDRYRDIRVKLRMSALVTLGGNARAEPVQTRGSLFWVNGLGWCRLQAPLYCEAPFRQPRLIASMSSEAYLPPYSPFPAELALDPMQDFFFRADPAILPGYTRDTELTLEDPVQRFLYSFELDDVRLADYVVPAKEPQ